MSTEPDTLNVCQIMVLAVCDTGQVVQLEISPEAEDRIYEILEMEEDVFVADHTIDAQSEN